jgi:nucleoside-diphosphate-sugar epimerase
MKATRDTVLVTGSSGLIGRATVARLATSYDVVGFDVVKPPSGSPRMDFINVDVTSDESVQAGLHQVRRRHGDRIASVIHLAAYADLSDEPSPLYYAVTIHGTDRLLRGLHEFYVGQFVFSGTALVHAPCEPGEQITEDSPLDPRGEYAESQVRTENLIRAERDDIPAVLLRIAGVYDDCCHSVPLAHQIRRIYERHLTSHVHPADPARGQAFVHLDDVADAIVRVIEQREQLPPETVLLIGERETLGYGELQEAFGKLIHREEWSTFRVPKPVAKVGAWVRDHLPFVEDTSLKPWMIDRADDHYALDIRRARKLLGWKPRRSLRATLPDMIAALKHDPRGWYRENGLDYPKKLEEAAEPAGSRWD